MLQERDWLSRGYRLCRFSSLQDSRDGQAERMPESSNDFEVHDRAMGIKHNAGIVKAQDYSIVGSILGTLLTTSILLKRVSYISSIVGGAAIGRSAVVRLAMS